MSGKRWFVDRNNGEGRKDSTSQVGGGSKTPAKADALKQTMRRQQPRGSSASFTVREGRR